MGRIQRNELLVGVLALAISVVGLFTDAPPFWQGYLFGYLFWSGLAIGCLGIFLLDNVAGGNWGVAIRRFIESGVQTLPLAGLFVIPIFFALHTLYKWTHPEVIAHDFAVCHKVAYMNVPFFIGSTVI